MEEHFKETNVGKKLSDLTVQRLICIVISIIFTVPLFSLETYSTEYTSNSSGLRFIDAYINDQSGVKFKVALDTYTTFMTGSEIRAPLIEMTYTQGDTK